MDKATQSKLLDESKEVGHTHLCRLSAQLARTHRDAASSAFLEWVENRRVDEQRLATKVAMLEHELACMKSSRSLLLGQALRESIRSWRAAYKLPATVFRLFRSNGIVSQATLDAVGITEDDTLEAVKTEPLKLSHVSLSGALCGDLEQPRIMAIVDELTQACLLGECQLLQPEPNCPDSILDNFAPQILFVESAWRGNRSSWSGHVHGASAALLKLIHFCRQREIPTVFWNKEDPVHFENFISCAAHFDIVLTTDYDCVERYRDRLPGIKVGVFPFSCQPRLYNPLLQRRRAAGFSFAGSFYDKYPERSRDFEMLVDLACEIGPVSIFDRNHGSHDPMFSFPDKYKSMVVGSLDAENLSVGLNGSYYSINVNTVKTSSTMFSRRVFELLGSGAITLSNQSVGMQRLFGDLVLAHPDATVLRRRLQDLEMDPLARRRLALLGLRKVLTEHTWKHRVAMLCEIAGIAIKVPPAPEVLVACRARNQDQLHQLIADFERQRYPHRKMVVVLPDQFGYSLEVFENENISLIRESEAHLYLLDDSDVLAGFHSDDAYGSSYLEDLVLAQHYCHKADAVGKNVFFEKFDDTGHVELIGDGSQYFSTDALRFRSALLLNWRVFAAGLVQFLDDLDSDAEAKGHHLFCLDEFNYCRNARGMLPRQACDGADAIDIGLQLREFLSPGERNH